MFSKILIANRGEIAVRIIHTCREMGIATVAIYSEVDQSALHVQLADEAYCVGPAPPLQSYLNVEAILLAVRESAADAVHPGYGFLAESAQFARSVQQAGCEWIGPEPDVIALLGDKMAAKQLARGAGLPVLPGYIGPDLSEARLAAEAAIIGYPLMLKAAAGGGGKGMRIVETPAALAASLEEARREALAAFNDDRVFIEKLLVKPRHIEMQILADTHGNVLQLGERDCSIQRRYQKVVEEAPSAVMTDVLRARMGEAAIRLVRASGYTNAGTVEFLFSGDSFFFLEVNTRIQVEHPVTEMVTGLDLVRLQINIAAGEALSFGQLDVSSRGHAIEARLYAEDPAQDFLPSTGTLSVFNPPNGPGIRNDVGVFPGAAVSQYYDPLLAKLVVWAETRAQAIARLAQALKHYEVLGVTTNVSFLQRIVRHPEFEAGSFDTNFLAVEWKPRAEEVPLEVLLAAVACDVTASVASGPWGRAGGWRVAGAERVLRYQLAGKEYSVGLVGDGALWRLTVRGSERCVRFHRPSKHSVLVRQGPHVLRFDVGEILGGIVVKWAGEVYRLRRSHGAGLAKRAEDRGSNANLLAPMPGTVVKVAVQPGQRVSERDALVVIEAMKMEHVIEAPRAGTIQEVLFAEGDLVPAGAAVVRMEGS